MKLVTSFASITVLALGAFAAYSAQQDEGGGPPVVEPSAQHALLDRKVGSWDATMSMMGMENAARFECRKLGELWTIGDYTGEFMGTPFAGNEVWGYDPAKKKYVSTWVDAWSDRIMLFEGDYDEKTSTLAMWTEGKDIATGETIRERHDTKFVDADTWVFTMNHPGPDGKYAPVMTITYRRRK